MPLRIELVGHREAMEYLERVHDGARAASELVYLVGSNLKYAFGINYGRHRGGRLARRAGGVHFMEAGRRAIAGRGDVIARAIPEGAAAVDRAGLRLANIAQAAAVAAETAVVTGTLRRSLHVVRGRIR